MLVEVLEDVADLGTDALDRVTHGEVKNVLVGEGV